VKHVFLVLLCVVVLYGGAYAALRLTHRIVHGAHWQPGGTGPQPPVQPLTGHWVATRDPDLYQPGPETPSSAAVHYGFLPLEWVERAYWERRYPVGSPWPYHQ
jgi:hypothetical protein